MIIGVDFDGVIADTEVLMNKMSLKYIKENLPHVYLVDKHNESVRKRFSWTLEEGLPFFRKATIIATEQAQFIDGAKKNLTKLKAKGFKLFINTARGQDNNIFNDLEVFYKKLDDFDFKFDKIIYGAKDKIKECLDNKIEIMIEDRKSICKQLAKHGIKCIYLNRYNFPSSDTSEIIEVKNWSEVYDEIIKLEKTNCPPFKK